MLPTPQTSTIFPYTTLFRSKLSAAQSELERLTQMGQRIEDLETLVEMGTEMNDKETLDEAAADLVRIKKDLDSLEVRTLLSGGLVKGFLVVHLGDRKSTRLNSSHVAISYAGFCF